MPRLSKDMPVFDTQKGTVLIDNDGGRQRETVAVFNCHGDAERVPQPGEVSNFSSLDKGFVFWNIEVRHLSAMLLSRMRRKAKWVAVAIQVGADWNVKILHGTRTMKKGTMVIFHPPGVSGTGSS